MHRHAASLTRQEHAMIKSLLFNIRQSTQLTALINNLSLRGDYLSLNMVSSDILERRFAVQLSTEAWASPARRSGC
jgi:hypothetical protein